MRLAVEGDRVRVLDRDGEGVLQQKSSQSVTRSHIGTGRMGLDLTPLLVLPE